jgi:hypothetical protein
MADEAKAPAAKVLGRPAGQDVSIQVGDGESQSLDLGVTGLEQGQNQHKVVNTTDGIQAEVGMGNADTIRLENANLGEAPKDAGIGPDGKPLPAAEPPAAMVDFDPAKPDVVASYNKAYLDPSGAPSMEKLSAAWVPTKDASGNVTGGALPEATYRFLESKGYDRATVKSVEAGQIALAMADVGDTFKLAGGEPEYRMAQRWAIDTWSKEQRDTYNADRSAGGVRRANAVRLLMSDFTTAVPKERRVVPLRSVGAQGGNSAGGAGAVEGYATKAEWQKASREARQSNNQAALNESRARMKASAWYEG